MVPAILSAALVLGPGVLAPASPGVLEAVQATRLRYGYGLSEPAPDGAALIAVENCEYLGRWGMVIIKKRSIPIYVVDCQNRDERPRLSELGIVADINDLSLGHKQATIILLSSKQINYPKLIRANLVE